MFSAQLAIYLTLCLIMERKINIYIIRGNLISNVYTNLEEVVEYHFKNDSSKINSFENFYNELISRDSFRNEKETNLWKTNKVTSDLGSKIGFIQLHIDTRKTEKNVISNALKDLLSKATDYNYDVFFSGQKNIIKPDKLKKLRDEILHKSFALIIFSVLFFLISGYTYDIINGLEIFHAGGKNAIVSVVLIELSKLINEHIEYELFKSIGWSIIMIFFFRIGITVYNYIIEKESIRNRNNIKKTKHNTI